MKSLLKMSGARAASVLLALLVSSLSCYAGDVILIRPAGDPSPEQKQLELAAQFYGLNLQVITTSANSSAPLLNGAELNLVRQNSTLAVVIEGNALPAVPQRVLLAALNQKSGSVPVLILGITQDTDKALLTAWSGGAVAGIHRLANAGSLHYSVDRVGGLTDKLSKLEIPFPGDATFYFTPAAGSIAQEVLAVGNDHQTVQTVPTFVVTEVEHHKIFLLCKRSVAENGAEANGDNVITAFAKVAPVMIFAKYAAGVHGWHALQHYANFTIDDPWLHEPYGHLDYEGLLRQMESHNFHTTIAFIPWNYDRSEAPLVALFRSHSERYSICVHGDNHDHREFDDLASRPLNVQTVALEQSLARMEMFHALTGISYDPVFVFPHNIGSESILEKLKAYNFTATVNAGNIPMDRTRPQSPLFALRPVTLAFGNFPSIDRFTAAMPNPAAFIGINEFLDNPLFFYAHQEFFNHGIDAFDGMADSVNKIEPDMHWRSVGEIAKHLYLIRERDDASYDVLTFSRSIDLENSLNHDEVFHVQKLESGSPLIASVTAGGKQIPFDLQGGDLETTVTVPAGQSRNVAIEYKNDLNLPAVSIAKNSLRVNVLRRISDFRDITLSKYSVGRDVTEFYYKHGASPAIIIVCGCGLIVLSFCGAWWLIAIFKKNSRKKNEKSTAAPSCANESPVARRASAAQR